MRPSKIKFARTPVLFAVVFTVFSLVLSLAAPRLHIATDNAPLGELTPEVGRNGQAIYAGSDLGTETLPVSDPNTTAIPINEVRHRMDIIPDGSGNSIAATDANGTVMLQKFAPDGTALWGSEGVGIVWNGFGGVSDEQLVSDDAGGAWLTWRSDKAYAQRVTSAGVTAFSQPITLGTAAPCDDASGSWFEYAPQWNFAGPDGSGGVIVGWNSSSAVCGQRVDTDGHLLWGDGAVDVQALGLSGLWNMAPDGSGGAYFLATYNYTDVLHVDAAGGISNGGCFAYIGPPNNAWAGRAFADGHGNLLYLNNNTGNLQKILPDCSFDQTWPADGVLAEVPGTFISETINGSQMIILSQDQNAVGGATMVANLVDLTTGTLIWGPQIVVPSYEDDTYNWGETSTAVVSGSDYLILATKATPNGNNDLETGGAVLMELDGATGSPVPSYGPGIEILDPHGLPQGAISDGAGGIDVVAMQNPNAASQPLKAFIYRYDGDGNLLHTNPILYYATYQHTIAITGDADDGGDSWNHPPQGAAAPNGDRAVAWTVVESYTHNFGPNTATTYLKILDPNGASIGANIVVDASVRSGDSEGGLVDLAADESGIYAYYDHATDGGKYLAVQKYDFSGNPLWTTGGVQVTTTDFPVDRCARISLDGLGGAYVTFCDNTGGWGEGGLLAARIAPDGSLPWTPGGVLLTTGPWFIPYLHTDSQHGIYIASFCLHQDPVAGWIYGTCLSRLDISGNPMPGFAGNDPSLVGVQIGSPHFGPGGIVPADGDNIYVMTLDDYGGNGVEVQKVGPTGTELWPDHGIVLDSRFGFTNGHSYWNNDQMQTAVSDGDNGIIVSWDVDNVGNFVQQIGPTGQKSWGTSVSASLAAGLAGGETTVEVASTAGFLDSGAVTIGGVQVRYSSKDDTNFYGCTNVPAAAIGATATQRVGLMYDDSTNIGELPAFALVSDGTGGAVAVDYAAYDNTPLPYSPNQGSDVFMAYIGNSGSVLYGGRITLDGSRSFSQGDNPSNDVPYQVPPVLLRSGSKIFTAWLTRRASSDPTEYPYLGLFAQQFTIPAISQPSSSPSSAPTQTAPVLGNNQNGNTNGNNNGNTNNPAGPSPVEPLVNGATFHFTNPGNATSFKLYDAPPGSSMHLLATANDPAATSITETDLQPNTTYGDRVLTASSNGTESAPSPPFPSFTTLLPNLDSVTPVYDPNTKTVSFTGAGTLPGLTTGQSGLDFVISTKDGKSIFDSGFLQTLGTGALSAVDLEPGESYTMTTTTRNQAGDLGTPEDFPIVIPAANFGAANITLTKTADTTQIPVTNTKTKVTTQATKEVTYSIIAANSGTGNANNFVMTDPLPDGLDFKIGSINIISDLDDPDDVVLASYDPDTRTIKATIRELEPNESFTITFVVTPASATTGSVKNKASATWEE